MHKKKQDKRYALIKKGAITPIIVSDYDTIKRLYDNSSETTKKLMKIEEVLR